MERAYRRINVMIGEEQYQTLAERGLNVSGLIRDLLGDYLADSVITLQVGEETREVYDTVISNTGATDVDLEIHLRRALVSLLDQKIADMQALQERLLGPQQPDYSP